MPPAVEITQLGATLMAVGFGAGVVAGAGFFLAWTCLDWLLSLISPRSA